MDHTLIPWIQIPVSNMDRAANFYQQVFGAEFFFETLRDKPHAVFKEDASGKRPVNGALVQFDGDVQPGTGVVLFFNATGKFEGMEERIEKHGGKILVPKTLIKLEQDGGAVIPRTYIDDETGYFAHFLDSEGNRMGLYGPY